VFFVLSKTLNYLTMIMVLVTVFFFLAAFLKNQKWRKRSFWIAFGMLLFFSNDFIANEMMAAWELEATPMDKITRKYEVGIVLTGITSGYREPADRVYFQKGADRLVHTVQLYKAGIIRKVLISGGSGRLVETYMPEADELKKAALLMGVLEEDIILENQSRNTAESAQEVKKILGPTKASDCLLITSAFHMRRSRACFEKAGIPMDTFTTDFYSHPRSYYPDTFLVPSTEAINLWQKLIKEWVGMIAYKAAGYI
jgi:uncharacterized SAM-binding protein YcdF (DUF218 family)